MSLFSQPYCQNSMALLLERFDAAKYTVYQLEAAGNRGLFFSVFNYLIVYRDKYRPIQIVRVLHGARDVKRLLEE
jgi:plasmid stabilization system protein ParE